MSLNQLYKRLDKFVHDICPVDWTHFLWAANLYYILLLTFQFLVWLSIRLGSNANSSCYSWRSCFDTCFIILFFCVLWYWTVHLFEWLNKFLDQFLFFLFVLLIVFLLTELCVFKQFIFWELDVFILYSNFEYEDKNRS